MNVLGALISDSRRVVTTLEDVGAPADLHGRERAAQIVATFARSEENYARSLSELRREGEEPKVVPQLTKDAETFILVGREIEQLPDTPERKLAMARSPVCQDMFGTVRVGEQPQAGK
jgi:hypothetical protein